MSPALGAARAGRDEAGWRAGLWNPVRAAAVRAQVLSAGMARVAAAAVPPRYAQMLSCGKPGELSTVTASSLLCALLIESREKNVASVSLLENVCYVAFCCEFACVVFANETMGGGAETAHQTKQVRKTDGCFEWSVCPVTSFDQLSVATVQTEARLPRQVFWFQQKKQQPCLHECRDQHIS